MRCTVVHCTLTACLQGEFWRNGTKVLCSCSIAHALRRNHLRDFLVNTALWHFPCEGFHPNNVLKSTLRGEQFICPNPLQRFCYNSQPSTNPTHRRAILTNLASAILNRSTKGSEVMIRYLLLSIPHVDMWMTFAYINRPADRVRGHETEISVGNTQMFVLKSKNQPVVLDFEAVVTNPSSQPNSL